ncbi:MAG: type 4a pilus biogenesis protein PilO [Francisella sp.]
MIDKINDFLSSKYISKVINAPIKIKIAVMSVIFVLFMLFFYTMLVNPIFAKITQVQDHIQKMEDQIPQLIKREKDLKELKKHIKTLEQHLTETRFSIPEKHSVPIFLSDLNNAISSSGMTIIDLSPAGVEKNKYLDLYALNFKAKLSGDFSQLIKLFVALIDMKDIAVITNLNIKKESDDKLVVELNLQTYSRQGVGV